MIRVTFCARAFLFLFNLSLIIILVAGDEFPRTFSSSSSSDKSAQVTSDNIRIHESEEILRKELIKSQILQRLGLSEKPVRSGGGGGQISRDLILATLHRTENFTMNEPVDGSADNTGGDQEEPLPPKTSEIISFPEKGPYLNDQPLLTFSYAGNHAYGVGVRIKKANLWVKMDYRSSIGRHFGHLLHPRGVTLYVFLCSTPKRMNSTNLRNLHLKSQEVSLELVISKTISVDSLGWQKLDITKVLQKWYDKINRHRVRHQHQHASSSAKDLHKLTLLVDCSGCGHYIHPIIFTNNENETMNDVMLKDNSISEEENQQRPETPEESLSETPFLVLETESSQNFKRSRRRALECSPRVKHCCKQRFYVSFKDLGWDDWIIAPKGYYANFCRGHCGGFHRTPDTFLNYHTHVIEEYRRTEAGQEALSNLVPCCAPVKFSPMSLIYFGPDMNIIKRDLQNMIVTECGCP